MTTVRGALDDCRFVDASMRNVDRDGTFRIPVGSSVYLRGWTLLESPRRVPTGARLRVGESIREVSIDRERPDVPDANDDESLVTCGFRLVASLEKLALGSQRLSLSARDGSETFEFAGLNFEIVSAREHLAAKTLAAPGRLTFGLDAIETERGLIAVEGSTIEGVAGEVVTLHGWAVDTIARRGPSAVYGVVDRESFFGAKTTLTRDDVARSLGMPFARRCGFVIRIPTASLGLGTHALDVYAVSTDGTSYGEAVVGPLALSR